MYGTILNMIATWSLKGAIKAFLLYFINAFGFAKRLYNKSVTKVKLIKPTNASKVAVKLAQNPIGLILPYNICKFLCGE